MAGHWIALLVLSIVIVIAIALYFIIKKLLAPKLHVKSCDMPSNILSHPDPTLGIHRTLRADYLRTSFGWIASESKTANDISSIIQDFKFHLCALQSYDGIMYNLVQEHKDRIDNNDKSSSDLMKDMLNLISEVYFSYDRTQNKLNDLLEIKSSRNVRNVASIEDIQFSMFNYELLNSLGQRVMNSIYSVFNMENDRSIIVSYTMSVQCVMNECDRKLVSFEQMKPQNTRGGAMRR